MTNLHLKGHKWLAGKQRANATGRVIYARSVASVECPATLGRTNWNVDDGGGGLLRVESRDFIIKVGDLVLDGVEVEPQAGDRITDGDFIYEVSEPAPSAGHWTWDSEYRHRYRIHTKHIDLVP